MYKILFAFLFFSVTLVHAQWLQQGNKLVGSDADGFAQQGCSVGISGLNNTVIIGGSGDHSGLGAAWIFTRNNDVWSQSGNKLVGSNAVGPSVMQGAAVAISSDATTAIIGGPADNKYHGAVWIFTNDGTGWRQQGNKFAASDTSGMAWFGISVALSDNGNTALVGGFTDNGGVGAAWVFTRSAGVWTQQGTKLIPNDAAGKAQFGYAVSLADNGNTAIVSGWHDNANAGAVWIFTRSGNVWSQLGSKLVGTGVIATTYFGSSVAIAGDGHSALIGGYGDNQTIGAMWEFINGGNGSAWTQQGDKITGTGVFGEARFGQAVSLSGEGSFGLCTAPYDSASNGAAFLFVHSGNSWTQVAGPKFIGTGAVGHAQQGTSCAMSRDWSTFIVGGFQDSSTAGAAWVFAIPPSSVASPTENIPGELALMQNYPNPFRDMTSITFQNPSEGVVTLMVRDLLGRRIATLADEVRPAGTFTTSFDASTLPRGVYWYTVSATPTNSAQRAPLQPPQSRCMMITE